MTEPDRLSSAQREVIDEKLAPYREAASRSNFFYDVDVRDLTKDDLLALVQWSLANARDRRRDN